MRWTPKQEEILALNAPLGAEACRKAIHRGTGVIRSVSSVVSHAQRMGVSLAKANPCPICGEPLKAGAKGRICAACRYERGIERQIRRSDYLESLKNGGGKREADARKKYDRLRKANERAAKSIGAGLEKK